jgi:diacylglycerol kinase family enzyme
VYLVYLNKYFEFPGSNKFIECDRSTDHRKITSNITMAVVANGKFLGGGFNAAPRAKITDGKLDVVIMKSSGSLKCSKNL